MVLKFRTDESHSEQTLPAFDHEAQKKSGKPANTMTHLHGLLISLSEERENTISVIATCGA